MKKLIIKFLTILTFSMSLGSCSDFLDVRPKSSYPDYLMFSSSEGFVHALNGVYLVMRNTVYHPYSAYYGGYNNASIGFFEHLGCGWVQGGNVLTAKEANLYAHKYDFPLVQSDILSYFKGQYKIVTNLNLILKWIDDKEQNFLIDQLYCMVKGEALALRAYIMFELIQSFGPSPTSTSLHNNQYIPYPYVLSTNQYKKVTYTDFMDLLWKDITEAEKMLEKYDPIIEYSVADLASKSDWSKRRNNKMNYYALMGLKARVQLYKGDKPGALQSALTVINAKNDDGTEKFPFMAADNYSETKDLIGVSEHMFAFEHDRVASSWARNPNDQDVPQYFVTYSSSSRKVGTTWDAPTVYTYKLAPNGLHLMERFPNAEFVDVYGVRTQDLRLEKWFFRSSTKVLCQKYYPLSQDGHTSALPIMRKAEMLIIAAECEPELDKAAEYINTLRQARWLSSITLGLSIVYEKDANGEEILDENNKRVVKYAANHVIANPYTPVTMANQKERMHWVLGEYSREFILEGRAFFAWKRLGLGLGRGLVDSDQDKIPYPVAYYDANNALHGEVSMNDEAYILPIPSTEVYYLD